MRKERAVVMESVSQSEPTLLGRGTEEGRCTVKRASVGVARHFPAIRPDAPCWEDQTRFSPEHYLVSKGLSAMSAKGLASRHERYTAAV
jgi:hypothetical protein